MSHCDNCDNSSKLHIGSALQTPLLPLMPSAYAVSPNTMDNISRTSSRQKYHPNHNQQSAATVNTWQVFCNPSVRHCKYLYYSRTELCISQQAICTPSADRATEFRMSIKSMTVYTIQQQAKAVPYSLSWQLQKWKRQESASESLLPCKPSVV